MLRVVPFERKQKKIRLLFKSCLSRKISIKFIFLFVETCMKLRHREILEKEFLL